MLDTELDSLPRLIADAAEPLPDIDDRTFGEFLGTPEPGSNNGS